MTKKPRSSWMKIAIREWNRILERKTYWLLMVILPPVITVFLGSIYLKGSVTDIPVGIVDLDQTPLSRMLIRAIDDSKALSVESHYLSVTEARQALLFGRLQTIVVIPDGLTSDAKSGRPGSVTVLKNASNLLYSNSVTKEISTIVRTVSAGILVRRFEAKGQQPDQALASADPIKVDTHALYNPTYNYEQFLIPSLLAMVLLLGVMVVSVLVIADEFREGTWQEVLDLSGSDWLVIFSGKSLPHLFIHGLQAVVLVFFWFHVFGIHLSGSAAGAVFLLFLLISAGFFLGMAVSCWIHDEFLSTEVAIFFNTPAFIFSGLTFPLWAMPGLHQGFAGILPFTHFLRAWVKLAVMNTPADSWLGDVLILGGFSLLGMVLSLLFLYQSTRPGFVIEEAHPEVIV